MPSVLLSSKLLAEQISALYSSREAWKSLCLSAGICSHPRLTSPLPPSSLPLLSLLKTFQVHPRPLKAVLSAHTSQLSLTFPGCVSHGTSRSMLQVAMRAPATKSVVCGRWADKSPGVLALTLPAA